MEGDGPLQRLSQAAAGVQVDRLAVAFSDLEVALEEALLLGLLYVGDGPLVVQAGLADDGGVDGSLGQQGQVRRQGRLRVAQCQRQQIFTKVFPRNKLVISPYNPPLEPF